MSAPAALHSNKSAEWYTPADIVDRARIVLGGQIDFDPASCDTANETVRATAFYDKRTNGLKTPWPCDVNIFCNPPSGVSRPPFSPMLGKVLASPSKPIQFWELLATVAQARLITHGIYVAFALNQLANSQACDQDMLSYPLCVPRHRLRFTPKRRKKRNRPSHNNAIVYVPGSVDQSALFQRVFSELGSVTEIGRVGYQVRL